EPAEERVEPRRRVAADRLRARIRDETVPDARLLEGRSLWAAARAFHVGRGVEAIRWHAPILGAGRDTLPVRPSPWPVRPPPATRGRAWRRARCGAPPLPRPTMRRPTARRPRPSRTAASRLGHGGC